MNYVELINKEAFNGNWDQVIRLAQKAKEINTIESFFGIKKGYLNLFKGKAGQLKKLNDLENIIVFDFDNQPEFGSAIKNGKINHEIVNNNFVIIFYSKDTVLGRLIKLDYSLLHFTIRHSYSKILFKGSDPSGYVVKNMESGQQTVFENMNQLIALERERRIDKILKD